MTKKDYVAIDEFATVPRTNAHDQLLADKAALVKALREIISKQTMPRNLAVPAMVEVARAALAAAGER